MRKYWGEVTEEEKEEQKQSASETSSATAVKAEGNHIYFYNGVSKNSVLELNKLLQQISAELLIASMKMGLGKPKLYLHINSYGGSIFDGLAALDTILRIRKQVDIITIIDGCTASAATFLSVVGTERWMHRHSYMLIHQLSSDNWGKYRELKDNMKNNDEMMRMIKKIYSKYTKVSGKKIDDILDHDLWWKAEKCLKMGLVDKII